jgi:hypothetical protein
LSKRPVRQVDTDRISDRISPLVERPAKVYLTPSFESRQSAAELSIRVGMYVCLKDVEKGHFMLRCDPWIMTGGRNRRIVGWVESYETHHLM